MHIFGREVVPVVHLHVRKLEDLILGVVAILSVALELVTWSLIGMKIHGPYRALGKINVSYVGKKHEGGKVVRQFIGDLFLVVGKREILLDVVINLFPRHI